MPAYGQTAFTVALRQPAADEEAAFATVESRTVIPARARIGGKISKLRGTIGDEVTDGRQIALIAHESCHGRFNRSRRKSSD